MKILVLDNYDSFTYNLVYIIKDLGYQNVDVFFNKKIDIHQVAQYDKIILSPGPKLPKDAGIMMKLIEIYNKTKPILGVCLGHQAIGEYFGYKLHNLTSVLHGVSSTAHITNHSSLFRGLPKKITIGHYHSWVIENDTNNKSLEFTCFDKNGNIMALQHNEYPIFGVQFHPESVMTPLGRNILSNFLSF